MFVLELATEKEIIQELAKKLREVRIQQNKTQIQLSIDADLSVATVRRFESGSSISLEYFIKILQALGLIGELKILLEPKYKSIVELEIATKIKQRKRVYPRNKK